MTGTRATKLLKLQTKLVHIGLAQHSVCGVGVGRSWVGWGWVVGVQGIGRALRFCAGQGIWDDPRFPDPESTLPCFPVVLG